MPTSIVLQEAIFGHRRGTDGERGPVDTDDADARRVVRDDWAGRRLVDGS